MKMGEAWLDPSPPATATMAYKIKNEHTIVTTTFIQNLKSGLGGSGVQSLELRV